MSRSNPTDNSPNPCKRWFEWDGSNGIVRYYDKDKKQNIDIGSDMTFILLDELASIKGWHDGSDSGIFSNEIKDTRAEVFVVKSFKGGELVSGFYKSIRDRVSAMGGVFTANCYIAFREEGALQLGSIQFKGAALNAWVEFKKANRSDILKKAVRINGSTEGKKGKIIFKVPNFFIKDITEETNEQAVEIDRELQSYLKTYFLRTRTEQAVPAAHPEEEPLEEPEFEHSEPEASEPEPSDIPW